jgi:hypothetical protein
MKQWHTPRHVEVVVLVAERAHPVRLPKARDPLVQRAVEETMYTMIHALPTGCCTFFSLFAFSSGFTRGGLVTHNLSSLPGLAIFCNQLAYGRDDAAASGY